MAFIEAKHIYKQFGSGAHILPVLRDVSLVVDHGEFIALTGPSGSGKSTFMNILGCLDVPTAGDYFIEGINVAHMTPDQLAHIRNKKIGFIFQQFNLLPDLSALDNVALPQLYADKKESEARAYSTQLLELVGLSGRMHHYPYQLSGGEQQRVAIARALSNKPTLILADEPTGNLDSKTGEKIWGIFEQLHEKENITIVIVTHDLALAQKTHRIVRLLDGAIQSDTRL